MNKNTGSGFGTGPANFAITIAESNDNDSFYTVTVADIDKNWDGTAHKIMPLVSSDKNGQTIQYNIESGDYISENKAYSWNYKKWAKLNAGDILKSWVPTSKANYKDFVSTEVNTSTSMDLIVKGPVTTITNFEFTEINGSPYVIFHNETIGNDTASGFVFNNEKQYIEEGLDSKYSFLLSYVGEAN